MKSFKFRYIISFVLLVALFFLAFVLQKKYKWICLDPLDGTVDQNTYQKFSIKDWFSGKYQENTEAYINSKFYFRTFFTRLSNEISFDLFGKIRANGVVLGKENYLYELGYIKTYYGIDYIGEDSIRTRLYKLKCLQDTLAAMGKSLLLVFEPSKGAFYPEYFPQDLVLEYSKQQKTRTINATQN